MNDFMADSESTTYGHRHMKARLKEHFGDQIFLITEITGKSNVVTFRSTAETILHEFHARQNDNPEEEKKHIIKAAAKLIKNGIKLVDLQLKTIHLRLKLKLKRDVLISFLTLLSFS